MLEGAGLSFNNRCSGLRAAGGRDGGTGCQQVRGNEIIQECRVNLGNRPGWGKRMCGRGTCRHVQKCIHCHSKDEGFKLLFSQILILQFKTELIQTKKEQKWVQ